MLIHRAGALTLSAVLVLAKLAHSQQLPETPTEARPPAVVAMNPSRIILPEGTAVVFRSDQAIEGEKIKLNDPVPFSVAKDVIVGEQVVIPAFTKVHAVIASLQEPRRMGRGGSLAVKVTSVRLINGVEASLRATRTVQGSGTQGEMVGALLNPTFPVIFLPPLVPLVFLSKGNYPNLPPGSTVTAYLASSLEMDAAPVIAANQELAARRAARHRALGEEALVYIYRPYAKGASSWGVPILVDGESVWELPAGTFAALRVSAGKHVFHSTGKNSTGQELDLKPGEIRFLMVEVRGSWSPSGILKEIPERDATDRIPLLAALFPRIDTTSDRRDSLGSEAVVYVYRSDGQYGRIEPVFLDGKKIWDLSDGTFAAVKVPAGEHLFHSKNKSSGEQDLNLKPRDIRFLKISATKGSLQPRLGNLQEVPEKEATEEIMFLKTSYSVQSRLQAQKQLEQRIETALPEPPMPGVTTALISPR